MTGIESGGDPSDGSHLAGPQQVISHYSPDPRGSIRGSTGGGVPPVGTPHRPGPLGADTAGHGAEFPPNMPQAIAPGIWSSQLVQAAIAEATRSQSVSAPTTAAPPAHQPTAEPVDTPKKEKKRRAADPIPELPPAGKKQKKRKGKKQSGSATQGGGPPNEAQLLAMMKLMAEKHGWMVDDSPSLPTSPPLVPPTPAYPARGTGIISRAPAALGAPPGEETFTLPMGPPPPPPAREREYVDPISSASSESDWSLTPDPSATDVDGGSVTSTAPTLSEMEAPPALRHLSEEAEALLLRYLGEFYSVPADPAADQPQGSRLFRADAAPSPGIPLTADFKAEYDRITHEPTPTLRASGIRRAFLFQPKDTEKYFSPEILSPEVIALGDHAGRGGRLRHKTYLTEDKRWTHMATFARSAMRLAAYAGALTNLAMQAAERQVTQEDRQLLDSLLLAITELLWKQSTRAAMFTTRRRRDLALSALGFPDRQRAQLVRDLPFEGPFLFSGQFTPRVKEQLAVRQQAREIAGQLQRTTPHRPRGAPQARPMNPPPRMTVTLPSPQPDRSASRGRRGQGGRRSRGRGQSSPRSAARGRGGF